MKELTVDAIFGNMTFIAVYTKWVNRYNYKCAKGECALLYW